MHEGWDFAAIYYQLIDNHDRTHGRAKVFRLDIGFRWNSLHSSA
jgi:hypothetical protein